MVIMEVLSTVNHTQAAAVSDAFKELEGKSLEAHPNPPGWRVCHSLLW